MQESAQNLLSNTDLTCSTAAVFFLTRLCLPGAGEGELSPLDGCRVCIIPVAVRCTAVCLWAALTHLDAFCIVRCFALPLQSETLSVSLLSWALLCPFPVCPVSEPWMGLLIDCWAFLVWILLLVDSEHSSTFISCSFGT